MSLTQNYTPPRRNWVGFARTWFRRMLAGTQAVAGSAIRSSRYAKLNWRTSATGLLLCTTTITVTLVAIGLYHVYLDRTNLPDLEPFVRFDFPTIGHVYDIHDQPLME